MNKHPLPDIKLFALDRQGMLDILLHYKLYISSKTIICNVIYVVEAPDSPPSRHDYYKINEYNWV